MWREWQTKLKWPHRSKVSRDNSELQDTPLPPQDSGFAAWTVLIAAMITLALLFSFPLSFGIFQAYYGRVYHDSTLLSWIGVLCSGLPFLGAPLMNYLCEHSPLRLQEWVYIGWVVFIIGLFSSAFCRSVPSLILLQGALCSIGLTVLEMPIFIMLNTWFARRRGLAYGLAFGGADVGGLLFTLLSGFLLGKVGFKITIFIYVACAVFLGGPAIFMLKPRKVHQSKSVESPIVDVTSPSADDPIVDDLCQKSRRFYKKAIYYLFLLANLSQSLAWYLPLIYLPSFARSLGFTTNQAALVLAMANLAQVFGEVGFGKASDKLHVSFLAVLSAFVTSLSTFLFWGFAKSYGSIISYGIIFALFGAGFAALWPRIGSLFGEKDATIIYSTMSLTRGIGALLSSPISTALLGPTSSPGELVGDAALARFVRVLMFVAVSTAISTVLGLLAAIIIWLKTDSSKNTLIREKSDRTAEGCQA